MRLDKELVVNTVVVVSAVVLVFGAIVIVFRLVAVNVESSAVVVRVGIFLVGEVVVVLPANFVVTLVVMVGGAVSVILAAPVVVCAVIFGVVAAPTISLRFTMSFKICRRQFSSCFIKSCS